MFLTTIISVCNSSDCKQFHIIFSSSPFVVSVHFKVLPDKYLYNQMSNFLHFNVKTQPQICYIDSDFIYCGCQYSLITIFHFWSLMKHLWVMMWKNVRMRKWCPLFPPSHDIFSIMSYVSQGWDCVAYLLYSLPTNPKTGTKRKEGVCFKRTLAMVLCDVLSGRTEDI